MSKPYTDLQILLLEQIERMDITDDLREHIQQMKRENEPGYRRTGKPARARHWRDWWRALRTGR